ncbi:endospore germination permease [Paenibacillus pasadenensis]|uniref:GerAB/ArcD/ProY family transporter n=1 Tax=Paenibacillus pasadenensis TaxID=217090 RepID=UPI00203C6610|nr:endospore germination permease [Paenibacillus pasadenensis]MCM3748741.1 endospore germination permease [Paenibacillus pasadenensis]
MDKLSNGVITTRQFRIIIVFSLIGDTILILPNIIGTEAGDDAWLSMLLAIGAGMLVAWLFASLAKRQAGHSLVGSALIMAGKWAGGFISFVYMYSFFIMILTLLVEISLFMETQMMHDTPPEAIILLFVIVLTASLRYGLESFAKMSELLFPIFLLMFLFLSFCLLPQAQLHELLPIASNGIMPILKGAFPAFGFAFMETAAILMLVPNLQGDAKAMSKAIRNGFLIGSSFLLVVVFMCIMVLGPEMMSAQYYPTFLLARRISIGNFLERVEALLAFLWIVTVFSKAALFAYALMKGIGEMIGLRDDKILAMPLALMLLAGTVINTPNIANYNMLLTYYYPVYDVYVYLSLPFIQFLLLGLPAVRKKLAKSREEREKHEPISEMD